MKRIFLILALFCPSLKSFADAFGYADTVTFTTTYKDFIVIHHHDWSAATRDARYKMISTNQDPFTAANHYAYIQCIDKKTGNTIFKKPCPALTKIVMSGDGKYIVGISNVKLWNPYQLVIYTATGSLLTRRSIGMEEGKLTVKQLDSFQKKFPDEYQYLKTTDRIYRDSGFYYIAYFNMGMPDKLKQSWDYLARYNVGNHLSHNFSESVTNWVEWYYETEPDIRFHYQASKLVSISLLDPEKKRFWIKMEG